MKTRFLKKVLGGTFAIIFSAFFAFGVLSCEIGLGESVDTEAPSGSIVSPGLDAVIRDTFAIKGTWKDDGVVSSVSVTLKNTGTDATHTYSGTVKTDGSWYCEIDPEADVVVDGSYLATVVLYDDGGHSTTLTRSYTIDNTPPLIILQRPSTKADAASADSYGQTFTLKGQAVDDSNVSKIVVDIFDNEACTGTPKHTVTLTNVPANMEETVAAYEKGSTSNDYYKIYGEYDESKKETKSFYCTLTAYDGAASYPLDGENDTDGNSTSTYYLYKDISTVISTYKNTVIYDMLNATYTGDSSNVTAVKTKLDEKVTTKSKFSLNPDNSPTFSVEGTGKLDSGDSLLDSNGELLTSSRVTNDAKSLIITISPGRDDISILADSAEYPLYVYLKECDENGNITGTTEIPLIKAYLNEAGTEWIISEGSGSVSVSESSYVITTETINTSNYAIQTFNTQTKKLYRVLVDAYDENSDSSSDVPYGNAVVEYNSKIYAFGLASSASTIETSISSSPDYVSAVSSNTATNALTVTLNYSYIDNNVYLYRTIGAAGTAEKLRYDSVTCDAEFTGTPEDEYALPAGSNVKITDTISASDMLLSDGTYASKVIYRLVSVNGEEEAASSAKTINVKHDNTIPVLESVTCPSTSETALSKFTFSGTVSDEDSGIAAVYLSITNNELIGDETEKRTTGVITASGNSAWTCKFENSEDEPLSDTYDVFATEGKKTVKVWAKDNVGLISEVYTNSDWIFDTSAPEFSLSSYVAGTLESDGSYTYSEDADDSVSITTNSSGAASFNIGKVFKLTGLASDNYGISEISVVQSDGTEKITLSSNDDDSGIIYDSDSGSWYLKDLPRSFEDKTKVGLPSSGTTSTYTYTFTISDSAGNSSNTTTKLTVVMDLTPPNVTITSPDSSAFGEDSVNGTAYTFRGTAADDDNGLGMQYYRYAITNSATAPSDSAAWTKVSYTSSGNWSFSKTLGSGTSGEDSAAVYEGNKYLHVVGVDKADNESDVHTVSFMIDQAAPSVTVVLQTAAEAADGSVVYTDQNQAASYNIKDATSIRFKVSASDTNGIKAVSAVKTLGDSSSVLTLTEQTDESGIWISDEITEEGSYTIVVTAEDLSGNGLTGDSAISGRKASVTGTVVFDKTNPVIDKVTVNGTEITSTTDNSSVWYNSNTVTVIVEASDNASGVSKVQYCTDISAAEPNWQDFSISSGTYRANVEFASEGVNTLYLRATDIIGNISPVFKTVDSSGAEIDGIVVKIDSSAPELETLWFKTGNVTDTASGTVYISGIKQNEISVYGTASDAESGIGSISFTMNGTAVTPSKLYFSTSEASVSEGENTTDWITAAENASSTDEGGFGLLSEFTDSTAVKTWKATFAADTVISGKFNVTVKNTAGGSYTLPAFTISVDSKEPSLTNIGFATSNSAYSVYTHKDENDAIDYYLLNNKNQTFTVSGIATDDKGVSKVAVSVEGYTSEIETTGEWSFAGIDLSNASGNTTLTVTAYDVAGNTKVESLTIYFDTSAPFARHWADYTNKDIYFRTGNADNTKTASATTSSGYVNDAGDNWVSELDENVGTSYSSGTYGNSSTIEIRGFFDESVDADGNQYEKSSGLKMIYYQIFDAAPTDEVIEELTKSYSSLPYYFSPLSEEVTRRVIYIADEAGTKKSKEVTTNFDATVSGFNSEKNYLVLIAVDNVGNVSADTLKGTYISSGIEKTGNEWNGTRASTTSTTDEGLPYYSIYLDSAVPDVSDTIYSNKSEQADKSLSGTIYSNLEEAESDYITLYGLAKDAESGIKDIVFTVNGNEISTSKSTYGTVSLVQTGTKTLGSATETLSVNNTYWEVTVKPSAFGSLDSGNVPVYAKLTDNAGTGNSQTVSIATVTIDKTPPDVTLSEPSDADSSASGIQINGVIALSGTITDANTLPDTSISEIQYSTDKKNWTSVTTQLMSDFTASGNYTYSVSGFDTTKLDDGTYYLRAAAKDIAGNTGYSDPVEVKVSQDSDRPVITFTNLSLAEKNDTTSAVTYMASDNSVWLKNTTTLMGIISDDDGIESLRYSTDGTNYNSVNVNNGSWSITLGEGGSTVYFEVKDTASKTFVSKKTATDTVGTPKISDGTYSITTGIPVYLKVDKTSPVTRNMQYAYYDESLAAPAYTELSGTLDSVGGKRTKVMLNLDAGDENDIESVAVEISVTENETTTTTTYTGTKQSSGTEAEADGKYYSNWTVSGIDVSGLSSGNTYATLVVTDKAGLTKSDTVVITVDNTYSKVSVTSPKSTTTVSGDVSVYGTLTETASLYYSVSPSPSDPDSVTTVSSWKDGEGNETTITEIAVDGWIKVEDASLSWTVNFNNIIDGSASGTNTKSLNKYLIDYGIAPADSASSAKDAIVSSFETYVTLYIHLKSVDAVGNEYVISYPVVVDPQGDRPSISFSYPATNAVTLGGKVSIYGTATDTVGTNIGVDSVWVQIKSTTHQAVEDTATYGTSPSYDESSDTVSMTLTKADLDYMASKGYMVYKMSSYKKDGTNTAWTSGTSSLENDESASDYAALATLSGAAWNISINNNSEFDPPSDSNSNPVAIRVFARDGDGKFSLQADRYVSFDADTPIISNLYVVKSSDKKIATDSTASKAYSKDMYVKGEWYLTGTAYDKDKIAELTIGSDTLIADGAVKTAWSDSVTLSSDKKQAEFKYLLSTSTGVGNLVFSVSATDDADGTKHTGTESISIKYDNTKPVIAEQTNSAFNISDDVCQSNSWYTFGSSAYEDAAADGTAQSGFAYTAFFFQRTYTSSGTAVNNIYDILQDKDSAKISLGSSIPVLGEETSTDDNTIVTDSDLYWYRKTISDISGNTFTVSDDKGIRVNALMKIDGSLYLITAVNGTSVTVGDTLQDDITTGYVAIAGIVDNTTPESSPSSGEIQSDGYYASPSRDDGDRMIESVDKNGTTWAWEANVCSRNISDGPVTIHYVVFDKAGNYQSDSVTGTISNNKPRIAGAIVKTDYNGDGDVADDGETINTYAAEKSYTEYYTGTTSSGAYVYDPDAKVKNTNAKNPLPTSITYGDTDSPVASLRGYTLIQPEIVGGNGALYYSYKVTNTDKTTSGRNETAFIEEGSTDYTAVTGNINVQLGDLLTFKDTADSNTAIPFEFTFWDSTEGLTKFTTSQSAKLTMYFAIQAAAVGTPSASITPFHWADLTDNSIYDSSSASSYSDLKGHIELEDDWKNAGGYDNAASGTQYDADPKVSGKITLTGSASDTKLIASLTASIFGHEYTVAEYSEDTGKLVSGYAQSAFATNGFWFELEDQTIGSSGHSAPWKLHIDTEQLSKINSSLTSVAEKDLAVTMTSTNFGEPVASTTGGILTGIDGTTKYAKTLTYKSPSSSTPGEVQTTSSSKTAFYRMDVVPYIVGVKTSLSSLKKAKSSVYDRTALGHYPVSSAETIYVYGFNLSDGSLYDKTNTASVLTEKTASGQSWYSSNAVPAGTVYSAGSIADFTSGEVYVSVNNIKSLNNVNGNDSNGDYSKTTTSTTGDYSVYKNYYNRQPNNDSNNLLSDNIELDVWAFDSDAVVPISGKIEQPHMGIDPATGQIGFAFVNGPLYFSMAGSTEDSKKTSYDYWMGSYDFFTSVGFAYDSLGNTYGVAAGGDINSASADKFQFMSSRWGRASRAQNGSYSSSNSLRLESIGQKDSSGTRYYDKQRIKSPSLVTSVHDSSTNVYLAYYDAMNDEIRFKAGNTSDSGTTYTLVVPVDYYDNTNNGYAYGHITLPAYQTFFTDGVEVTFCDYLGNEVSDFSDYAWGTSATYYAKSVRSSGNYTDYWFTLSTSSGGNGLDNTGYSFWNGEYSQGDNIRYPSTTLYVKFTATSNFGSFADYDVRGDSYQYRNGTVSLLAGNGTSYGAGSYVSLGVVPGNSSTTDVVVAVWFDETSRKLMYSYNTSPLTNRNGTTDRSGWSTPIAVFSGDMENSGEYCQLTVDKNGGIHIAAYDGSNCDLVYAYLSSYSAAAQTCVVDANGVVGSNITIDVALNSAGKAIPRIGYYATSCIRPKLAYLADTTSVNPAGSEDDAFTGAWECSVVPTSSSVSTQSNQYNKMNVGVWKDSTTGVVKSSTTGDSTYTNSPNSYSSTSYGFVYGNGTTNAVMGYAIKVNSSSDAIETAQMQ